MPKVTCNALINLGLGWSAASGPLSAQSVPLSLPLSALFRASGVAADQVDGLYYETFTLVASTPQTLDLLSSTQFVDPAGQPITAARARLVAFRVRWTTDNLPLKVGGAGTGEWAGFLSTGAILSVFPGSAINDGFFLLGAPQTTGIPIGGAAGHLLKLDPGAAAGTVDLLIATAST